MRPRNTTLSLEPHSGPDPLSHKREDESLLLGRLRVCARNEAKRREDGAVVSCLAVPHQIRILWNIGKTEPVY